MKRLFLLLFAVGVACSALGENPQNNLAVTPASPTETQPSTCRYRWFAELTNTFGTKDFAADYRIEATTIHGVQLNNLLFVGGGAGVCYFVDYEELRVPLFATLRIDLGSFKQTPYFDLRAGYSISSYGGAYLAPTVGVRFPLGAQRGLNLGLGYSYINEVGGLSLRIGLDF